MTLPPTDLPGEREEAIDVSGINRRMAKGAGWMILMQLAMRGIGLVSTVILARLLVPADFGLVALATMLYGALEVLGAFSFDLALIRDQRADRTHYDTVWTLTVLRGLLFAAITFLLAEYAAIFFEEPRLADVLRWLAIAPLLEGVVNVGVVDFRKEMEFHREFRYRVLMKISAFLVTVTMALIWRDYWALIAGILVGRVAQVVLSFTLHSFRPRLGLLRFVEILDFSKWLALNNILLFITNRADTFIIGKLVGVERLGLYSVAYEISNLPTTELVWPIQRAIFPGYAKLNEDHELLRRAYLNVLGLVLMFAVPAGIGIELVAEPLVKVFLGSKWLEAIPVIQVLAIYGVIRVGMGNAGSIFLAIGKPRILTALVIIGIVTRIPLLIWGTMMAGAVGAAWALVASASFSLTLSLGSVMYHLKLNALAILAVTWRTLCAVALMAAVVRLSLSAWPQTESIEDTILQLFAIVLIGASTYVGSIVAIWQLSGSPDGAEQQTLDLLRSKLVKRRTA